MKFTQFHFQIPKSLSPKVYRETGSFEQPETPDYNSEKQKIVKTTQSGLKDINIPQIDEKLDNANDDADNNDPKAYELDENGNHKTSKSLRQELQDTSLLNEMKLDTIEDINTTAYLDYLNNALGAIKTEVEANPESYKNHSVILRTRGGHEISKTGAIIDITESADSIKKYLETNRSAIKESANADLTTRTAEKNDTTANPYDALPTEEDPIVEVDAHTYRSLMDTPTYDTRYGSGALLHQSDIDKNKALEGLSAAQKDKDLKEAFENGINMMGMDLENLPEQTKSRISMIKTLGGFAEAVVQEAQKHPDDEHQKLIAIEGQKFIDELFVHTVSLIKNPEKKITELSNLPSFLEKEEVLIDPQNEDDVKKIQAKIMEKLRHGFGYQYELAIAMGMEGLQGVVQKLMDSKEINEEAIRSQAETTVKNQITESKREKIKKEIEKQLIVTNPETTVNEVNGYVDHYINGLVEMEHGRLLAEQVDYAILHNEDIQKSMSKGELAIWDQFNDSIGTNKWYNPFNLSDRNSDIATAITKEGIILVLSAAAVEFGVGAVAAAARLKKIQTIMTSIRAGASTVGEGALKIGQGALNFGGKGATKIKSGLSGSEWGQIALELGAKGKGLGKSGLSLLGKTPGKGLAAGALKGAPGFAKSVAINSVGFEMAYQAFSGMFKGETMNLFAKEDWSERIFWSAITFSGVEGAKRMSKMINGGLLNEARVDKYFKNNPPQNEFVKYIKSKSIAHGEYIQNALVTFPMEVSAIYITGMLQHAAYSDEDFFTGMMEHATEGGWGGFLTDILQTSAMVGGFKLGGLGTQSLANKITKGNLSKAATRPDLGKEHKLNLSIEKPIDIQADDLIRITNGPHKNSTFHITDKVIASDGTITYKAKKMTLNKTTGERIPGSDINLSAAELKDMRLLDKGRGEELAKINGKSFHKHDIFTFHKSAKETLTIRIENIGNHNGTKSIVYKTQQADGKFKKAETFDPADINKLQYKTDTNRTGRGKIVDNVDSHITKEVRYFEGETMKDENGELWKILSPDPTKPNEIRIAPVNTPGTGGKSLTAKEINEKFTSVEMNSGSIPVPTDSQEFTFRNSKPGTADKLKDGDTIILPKNMFRSGAEAITLRPNLKKLAGWNLTVKGTFNVNDQIFLRLESENGKFYIVRKNALKYFEKK